MRSWAIAFLVAAPLCVQAQTNDVLRYVPRNTELALVVENPRLLIDTVSGFEPLQQLFAFDAVQEQLQSTNARRVRQLVGYYEKTLGHAWPELIDRLAGGGAVLALRFDADPPTALVVFQSKDEELLRSAFGLAVGAVKSEIERNGSTFKVAEMRHRDIVVHQLGEEAFAAVAGPALFFSNKIDRLKTGIDLSLNGADESLAKSGKPEAALKLLPPQPLAWLFADLDRAHKSSQGQQAYAYPRGDPAQLIVLQGILDVIGKSPFVTAGGYRTPEGFRATIRMAAGQDATPPGLALHLPPAGQPGSLPCLEPKNVLFSTSFYLDVGKVWSEREKLLSEQLRKGLEDADKNLARYLAGRKLAELMQSIGPNHRLVIAAQERAAYNVQPDQMQPALAFVSDLRNPAYADAMNAVLRAVALFAGAQFNLKIKEEKIGDVTLVTYRFPEDTKVANDPTRARFNTSPSFARVGDQFLMCSTAELAREMIGLLLKPESNDPKLGRPQTTRMRAYATGGAELLRIFEDQLLTQSVLDRAVPVEQARKEAQAIIAWVRDLGRLEFDVTYGADDFRYDIALKWREKKN